MTENPTTHPLALSLPVFALLARSGQAVDPKLTQMSVNRHTSNAMSTTTAALLLIGAKMFVGSLVRS